MDNKLSISDNGSNLISPRNQFHFWEKGEMAYSALKRINELKANNEFEKAKTMMADWIFQKHLRQEINKIYRVKPKVNVNLDFS